jgi:hypothetical protein
MKPIKIENDEWLYKGCFIQKQTHPKLKPYHIFQDTKNKTTVGTCYTFFEAKKIAEIYEVKNPIHTVNDFIK